ncbi:MAG: metallophosphoesterase family protein [Actinobacteria bacterium]|nr:metallophosphoesterase family protein [Actinomycetota bacterium]
MTPSPATPSFAPGGRAALIKGLRVLFTLVTIAATVIAAYFALILSSSTEVAIGPVRVEFSLKPALHGKSIVDLPPAGSIEADTHTAPAVVNYSLKEISVADVGELTDPGSPSRQALDNWRDPVGAGVRSLILRVALVTVLVGAAVAGLLQRRWRWALAGAALGLFTAVAVGGMAYTSYDTSAFSEPRYEGGLTYAPEILDFSQQTLANLNSYEDRVPEIADSLYRTVSALHQIPQAPPEADTIRVLHVSDMHSSAAGADLTKSAVKLYNADFVIDTGDLTDLGTSFEMGYPATYLPLPVPYFWIGGNHDTPLVTRTMRETPGVTVLGDEFKTAGDMVIGGFPDPAALSITPEPSSDVIQAKEAARIAGLVDAQKPRPFMVAVHDPKQAVLLAGKVSVVVDGHTHRQGITVDKGTVFLDAGSTGGGGFRSFNHDAETPNTLQVLYIRKDSLKLVAVDSISISGFSQEFSVTRRVFGPDEGMVKETQLQQAVSAGSG